jgi:hypothetical protein
VKLSELSPLTEDLVQQCNDRTKDFTLALMDFVQWDDQQSKIGSITDLIGSPSSEQTPRKGTASLGSGTVDSETLEPSSPVSSHKQSGFGYYIWPVFLLNLLIDHEAWGAWRKKVERGDLTSSRSASVSTSVSTSVSNAQSSSSQAGVAATKTSDSDIEANTHTTRITARSAKRTTLKMPTRRRLYFDALCADRILELGYLKDEDRSPERDSDTGTG